MSKTYLISQETLQSETGLSENIDGDKLKISIWNVQQTKLRGILSNLLYDEVITQKSASTLTTLNETLLTTYILPYLSWASYVDFSIFSGVLSTATGLRVQKDDSSDPITDRTLNNLIAAANQKVKYYESQLVEYLVLKAESYPLYDAGYKVDSEFTNTLKITSIGKKNKPETVIRTTKWC